MFWPRNRPFQSRRLRAILAQCLDREPASAFCPMVFTSSRNPGRASAAHPKHDGEAWTVTDDWPDPVPITNAELDVFEAWFGNLFDELFGLHR